MSGRWSRCLLAVLLAAPAQAGPLDEARRLWQLRRTRSAIEALERVAQQPESAAEAQEWLGRIYFFRGWESEGAFPGWHEEPEYRDKALEAFRAAARFRPEWAEPRVGLGEALLRANRPADALAAFDEALASDPNAGAARVGRWRALKALARDGAVSEEVSAAAAGADPGRLDAARQGYELLGRTVEAETMAGRILERFPTSPAAEALRTDRIQKFRAAKQSAELIAEARSFLERFPASERLPAVYDALLAAYQATPATTAETIAAAIDARLKSRPDPGAYFAGVNLLLSRGARLDLAVKLAQEAVPAAETFVNENLGAYKLAEKARGSLNRMRATSADLVGWARFLQGNREAAAARLAEAERLSRGQDFSVQFHLGELTRAKGALPEARERYLSALSLAGGPEPLRAAAHKALVEIGTGEGQNVTSDATTVEAWLKTELDRRREERRAQLLRSMVDRPLPPLTLTSLAGEPVDLTKLRGKVLLLNFFASW